MDSRIKGYSKKYKGVAKQSRVIKPLKLPNIITEDLGYYMNFGFKQIPVGEDMKYQENKHSRLSTAGVTDYYG
tara:strand:+ start:4221 stop:4439 length:219 start_codon:yes stop_codon:yes gene_type:complete